MQLLGNNCFLAFKQVFRHCVCKPLYSATTPEDFNLDFKITLLMCTMFCCTLKFYKGMAGKGQVEWHCTNGQVIDEPISVFHYIGKEVVPHITMKYFGCGLQQISWVMGKIFLPSPLSLPFSLTVPLLPLGF